MGKDQACITQQKVEKYNTSSFPWIGTIDDCVSDIFKIVAAIYSSSLFIDK
jgi:hypothetical protein